MQSQNTSVYIRWLINVNFMISCLQINGRLFVFDGDHQNWLERGRGIFRLNDMRCNSSAFQSRLCKYHNLSCITRKSVFGVSGQVVHKLGCTVTEDG